MLSTKIRLLFGPIAAAILVVGIIGLAAIVPSYSHVSQTVSEIGEEGSPARIAFTILLLSVALCLMLFASGIRRRALESRCSTLPAYVVGAMAISAAGVGWFAFPHPLHNVFGISELLGYQAPLVFAIAWRRVEGSRSIVRFSWLMTVAVWVAILLNLSSLDRHGTLGALVAPYYGIVQRALFASWFGWVAAIGVLLARHDDR